MISPLDVFSIETWLLIFTVAALIRFYLHRKWSFFKNLNIPYAPPSILGLGNIMDAFRNKPFAYDLELKEKYGPVYGYFHGTIPMLTIHDLDMLRQVMQIPDRTLSKEKLSGECPGSTLTSVTGQQWKRIRSTLSPSFSTSKIKQMVEVVEWCVDNTVELLHKKNKTGDGTFNTKGLFTRLSLDIVLSSAFSTKVDSQDDTKREPEISVQAKKLFKRNMLSWVFYLFPSAQSILGKLGLHALPTGPLDYFTNLANAIIERREKSADAQNHIDLMQLMLQAHISEAEAEKNPDRGLTRIEIIANAVLLILAGYENTANTMRFLAYNLATHPDIQYGVQKEIDHMMKTHEKFDYDGLNSLKLLDMCVYESLRLYIPTMRNSRTPAKDITVNGIFIPALTVINIPAYTLAHDPQYWDEPYEFKPERMRNLNQIDPIMFQPFGAGPRMCIGIRFALLEVKMTMAKLLHKFSLRPARNTPKSPLQLTASSEISPKVDFDLRAEPRVSDD